MTLLVLRSSSRLLRNVVPSTSSHSSLRFASAPAAKAANLEAKSNFNIGTIGHIDHGKTTLTAAITKVLSKQGKAKFHRFDEIDKGKEEKQRGITINIAHVGYSSEKRRYAHTDCPGHRDFIKNMICGTAQMDAAVLVIAATDGVMAQTKEHLQLARQIGVQKIVVFVNKADLVEKDDLELVEIEARELLSDNGFDGDNAPVISGSALEALEGGDDSCVLELIRVLDDMPEPQRLQDAPLSMPISSRVQITGRGTVVVGTVEQGTLKKGDTVEIKGFDNEVKTVASDIQVFKQSVKQVTAGEHCGILCRGLKADMVERGMWMGKPGTIITSNLFKVEIYMLTDAEGGRKQGIRTGFTERVFCSTWDQPGRLSIPAELLMPGEHTTAHLLFLHQVPIRKNIPFTIREGRERTIARGVVSEIYQPLFVDSFHKIDFEKLLQDAKPLPNKSS